MVVECGDILKGISGIEQTLFQIGIRGRSAVFAMATNVT